MSEVKFEPFQRVLVRDFDGDVWRINFFSQKCGDYYECFVSHWKQCLPYTDETAHLLGTTDSPTPPEPKFKFGDHVEVRDDETSSWRKAVYLSVNRGTYYCLTESSGVCLWKFCRHADW